MERERVDLIASWRIVKMNGWMIERQRSFLGLGNGVVRAGWDLTHRGLLCVFWWGGGRLSQLSFSSWFWFKRKGVSVWNLFFGIW